MKNIGNHLIAGLAAGGGFAVILLALDLGLVPALIAAGVIYIGVLLVTRRRQAGQGDAAGLDEEALRGQLERFLAAAGPAAGRLRSMAGRLPSSDLRTRLLTVVDLLDRIINAVRQDPHHADDARSFLAQTLASTETIFRHCLEMQQSSDSAEIQAALRRADNSLAALQQAFQKELGRILENSVDDLDAELDVLSATLSLNGYASQEFAALEKASAAGDAPASDASDKTSADRVSAKKNKPAPSPASSKDGI